MAGWNLRLYRLLRRRPAAPATAPDWPARPAGRLVWLHAPDARAAGGFLPLIAGLRQAGLAGAVVVTCPEPLAGLPAITIAPPVDGFAAVARFLDHWRPDLGIWAAGGLRPVLLETARRRGLPLLLVEAVAPRLADGGDWWPGLRRGALTAFTRVLVVDQAAHRRLRRAGVAADRLIVTGRLDRPSRSLPANEAERVALARNLGTRPRWLAVGVPAAEFAAVAAAHLLALRAAHRLLLILVPAEVDQGPAAAECLRQRFGLQVALRSRDDELDEDVQVYIADTEGELGLWYRLAPLTWCGGTLAGPGATRHPFEAAAAASAIIHGPQIGEIGGFELLRGVGGSRQIADADELGAAIGDLLAPDLCARLAAAAWEVASGEAGATARLLDQAAGLLDPPA